MLCLQEALGRGVMQSGAQLVELDLSDNAFGPNGLVGVVELLKSSACFGLKIIRFNNNGLGIGGGKVRCTPQPGLICHQRCQVVGA